MKLNAIQESEIKKVMDDYWNSYFVGDLAHWEKYLADDYRNIGGTAEEIWNNKQEILNYTNRIIDQIKGLSEIRNKKIQIIPYEPYVMVHEFVDVYIQIENDWKFYQPFRLSSLIQETPDGWKVLHQHGSYPDSKTEDGEAFAFDSLKNENLRLQALVKSRTHELEQKNLELEMAMKNLKATQSQLIQSEKMASLGELTAGIAHEIQNPLNFVNNFSEINTELIKELKEEVDNGNLEDVAAIADDIASNSEKINHHGKRADSIVKGMLQHSRTSSGAKEPTDINALCDEYLRLAYHGLRAKDKSFNAALNTDFDPSIGKVDVMPQDIGRVVLNLINNAFYAVDEKKKASNGEVYDPTVSMGTKRTNGKVEISIADNGNGIPQQIVDKIFQPFFTTKPTGQGTGLGLSLSYDIVKAHGGELMVKTQDGIGSTFIIQLTAKEN